MDKPHYSFDATRELDAIVRSSVIANDAFFDRVEKLIFGDGANPHAAGIGARALRKHENGWSPIYTFLDAGVNPRWILIDLNGLLQTNEMSLDQFRVSKDRLFDATRSFTDREQQHIASRTMFGSPVEIIACTRKSGFDRMFKIRIERHAACRTYAEAIKMMSAPSRADGEILCAPTYDNEATHELELLLTGDPRVTGEARGRGLRRARSAPSQAETEIRDLVENKGANPHAEGLAAKHLVNAYSDQTILLLDYGVNPERVLIDLRVMEESKLITYPQLQKATDRLFEAALSFTAERQDEIAGRTLFGTPPEIRRMQTPGDIFMQYSYNNSKCASMFDLREAANRSYSEWKAAADLATATSSEQPPSKAGNVRPATVRSHTKPGENTL